MVWEFVLLLYRKTRRVYFSSLCVLLAYVLFKYTIHAGFDPFVVILSALHACFCSFHLFRDAPLDRSFILSLPMTRQHIFLVKAAFGLVMQVVSLLVLFTAFALGMRSGIQIAFGSPLFPAVKWYELNLLWTVGVTSFVCHSFCAYALVRSELLKAPFPSLSKWIKIAVFAVGLSVALFSLRLVRRLYLYVCLTTNLTELSIIFIAIAVLSLYVAFRAYRFVDVQS